MGYENTGISRRQWLRIAAGGIAASGTFSLFSACGSAEPKVRIAANVWPGYELLIMARERGKLDSNRVKFVEVPSATVAIQSLTTGGAEGALMTLDEVLSARAEGVDLKVIAVLDISMGADALVINPKISSLKALRGKRIGVEKSAVGAVMLAAALKSAGLASADVQSVYMTVNRHAEAYLSGAVDALVTFEPVKTQMIKAGARSVFDSSNIPGRIIDVLAVLPGALRDSRKALASLVEAQFESLAYFHAQPQAAARIISKRLQIDPEQVSDAYLGVDLPDMQRNLALMAGPSPKLLDAARALQQDMLEAKLLSRPVQVEDIIDASLLKERAVHA